MRPGVHILAVAVLAFGVAAPAPADVPRDQAVRRHAELNAILLRDVAEQWRTGEIDDGVMRSWTRTALDEALESIAMLLEVDAYAWRDGDRVALVARTFADIRAAAQDPARAEAAAYGLEELAGVLERGRRYPAHGLRGMERFITSLGDGARGWEPPDLGEGVAGQRRGSAAVPLDARGRAPSIPDGARPPPGWCRVWYFSRPASEQPPSLPCSAYDGVPVPEGAVLMSR